MKLFLKMDVVGTKVRATPVELKKWIYKKIDVAGTKVLATPFDLKNEFTASF